MTTAPRATTTDDTGVMLAETRRFIRQDVAPHARRPETPIGLESIRQITADAIALGLINQSAEHGAGLWERTETGGVSLTVDILDELATANAGVAWHLHQLAISRRIAVSLGLGTALGDGSVVASIQGAHGLARGALARHLRGWTLENGDLGLLTDYFNPAGMRRIIHTAAEDPAVLTPEFDGTQIVWRLASRDWLELERLNPGHGLDEIPSLAWRFAGEPSPPVTPPPEESRRIYAEALQLEALGIMAIGLGAVRRAHEIAADYAGTRKQGGAAIDQHPAVQRMLGGIGSTIDTATSSIRDLAARPPVLERTGEILSVRSLLQPEFCRAASAAMQVMGGSGYMRDVGVEKVLRDTNQLRLMSGTPIELAMFASEWARTA